MGTQSTIERLLATPREPGGVGHELASMPGGNLVVSFAPFPGPRAVARLKSGRDRDALSNDRWVPSESNLPDPGQLTRTLTISGIPPVVNRIDDLLECATPGSPRHLQVLQRRMYIRAPLTTKPYGEASWLCDQALALPGLEQSGPVVRRSQQQHCPPCLPVLHGA